MRIHRAIERLLRFQAAHIVKQRLYRQGKSSKRQKMMYQMKS
jgi:hypothetical protein